MARGGGGRLRRQDSSTPYHTYTDWVVHPVVELADVAVLPIPRIRHTHTCTIHAHIFFTEETLWKRSKDCFNSIKIFITCDER